MEATKGGGPTEATCTEEGTPPEAKKEHALAGAAEGEQEDACRDVTTSAKIVNPSLCKEERKAVAKNIKEQKRKEEEELIKADAAKIKAG